MRLFLVLPTLFFNQHLAGLINLMVEKSSGPVVEREMFLMTCFVSCFFFFFIRGALKGPVCKI